jgi:hypothetical protein
LQGIGKQSSLDEKGKVAGVGSCSLPVAFLCRAYLHETLLHGILPDRLLALEVDRLVHAQEADERKDKDTNEQYVIILYFHSYIRIFIPTFASLCKSTIFF